jgi:uncharacterized protein (DUF2267 family)
MRKAVTRSVMLGAGVALAAAVFARDSAPVRALRRGADRVPARLRYAAGRAEGLRYRLAGREPDPAAADDVIADRIRSTLGPLEKRLDLPHILVMVDDHVARLDGEVASRADAAAIEQAVLATSGVREVDSHLHVGLASGTTRPSTGREQAAHAPSLAMHRLLEAARDGGASEHDARACVQAVLATLAERIPEGERRQLLGHLPADVVALVGEPAVHAGAAPHPRTTADLVAAVAASDGVDPQHAGAITEALVGRLRELVPEEAADVAAVLPEELRRFWSSAVPG